MELTREDLIYANETQDQLRTLLSILSITLPSFAVLTKPLTQTRRSCTQDWGCTARAYSNTLQHSYAPVSSLSIDTRRGNTYLRSFRRQDLHAKFACEFCRTQQQRVLLSYPQIYPIARIPSCPFPSLVDPVALFRDISNPTSRFVSKRIFHFLQTQPLTRCSRMSPQNTAF